MEIREIQVVNYKSLRNVTWMPSRITTVIGANASGKSNLTDFVDFLSDLYRHGLSVAVARKGGYENIAHRKKRRSRSAMQVRITADLHGQEIFPHRALGSKANQDSNTIRFEHFFSFKTYGQGIKEDFEIQRERIILHEYRDNEFRKVLEINRSPQSLRTKANDFYRGSPDQIKNDHFHSFLTRQARAIVDFDDIFDIDTFPSTELAMEFYGRFSRLLGDVAKNLSEIRVFQFSPTNTRDAGVPVPNPEMDIHGGNLPAVVNMLRSSYPKEWQKILQLMQKVVPQLSKIEVDYTHLRTLGLYFFEKGFGRAWNVAEISDGTIHTLAILVAMYDPRTTLLILEEPENSVHTWILKNLMEAANEAANDKQIVMTTHSPVVVNSVSVDSVWVMWRRRGESHMGRIREFDMELVEAIDEGQIETFDLVETGAIPEAIPQGPDVSR